MYCLILIHISNTDDETLEFLQISVLVRHDQRTLEALKKIDFVHVSENNQSVSRSSVLIRSTSHLHLKVELETVNTDSIKLLYESSYLNNL